jgi:hypothetical protein
MRRKAPRTAFSLIGRWLDIALGKTADSDRSGHLFQDLSGHYSDFYSVTKPKSNAALG